MDFGRLAEALADLGAAPDVVARAQDANTAMEVLGLATDLPIAEVIARQAREVALATLAGDIAVDVVVFDRQGKLIGHAGP